MLMLMLFATPFFLRCHRRHCRAYATLFLSPLRCFSPLMLLLRCFADYYAMFHAMLLRRYSLFRYARRCRSLQDMLPPLDAITRAMPMRFAPYVTSSPPDIFRQLTTCRYHGCR